MVLIIGDYTARVGDPSGRSADPARSWSRAEIDRNAETYQEQAFRVLDRDRTEVRRNGEWLDMPMEDLFRLARTSTVAQILERDDFAKRYAGGEPISILELLYPLLQGYDSVAIESDVELGGTDQKFNVLLAREVQKAYGVEPQSILTHADPARDRRRAEDVEVARQLRGGRRPARGDVRQAHAGSGRGDAGLLRAAAGRAARGPTRATPSATWPTRSPRATTARTPPPRPGSASTPLHVRRELPDEIEEFAVQPPTDGQVHLPALMAEAFGLSRSEARRLLTQGGVRLDGEELDGASWTCRRTQLDGVVLQVGRRRFKKLRRCR